MRSRIVSAGILLVLFTVQLIPVQAQAADGLITRAELLQALIDSQPETKAKVDKIREHLSKLPLFLDVSQDQLIAPYAEVAFMSLITTGFPDRTLRPGESVPVEEAITLLMRTYHQSVSAPEEEWYVPSVRLALEKNLVASPQSMSIGQAITRAQFEDMVSRMQTVERDHLAVFPGPTPTNIAQVQAQPQVVSTDIRQYASERNFAISIPSLDINDLLITHPSDPSTSQGLLSVLQNGVGHLFSYPGRGGKIMIYGHSSGYSWDVSRYTKIFRQVNRLQPGDKVFVTYNGNLYEYSVTGQQTIDPKDSSPFSGDGEELILYTCWPLNSIKKRLIVRASPVETIALR